MKIKGNDGNFEPCPEYNGKGVCVDVTPLRKQQSEFGERDVFKVVFEVDMDREDGSRFCVWSRNFTPSLNEKANFRKFVRGWFGRDLSDAELEDFDTETLVGKGAQLVVVHEHKEGKVYANIAACTPDRTNAPLAPSGKYVRMKDRPTSVGANAAGAASQGGGQKSVGRGQNGGAPQGGYRRAQQAESNEGDLGATKIHVGRCKGLEVRDLSSEQVVALIEKWLPQAKAGAKQTADDKRLISALEWWEKENTVTVTEEDNVPY
jgi:hypothetical protein